jgi:diguanylate cyclase (GGDEF)-like protein/PAS domain S-box-containing protein
VRQQAAQVLSGHFPQPIEHRIIRKDGSIRWVESSIVPNHDLNGNLISYYGIVRDITECKKAENKPHEREEPFRLAVAATSDIIYDFDIESENMCWVGDIDTCLGYARSEFPNTPEAWAEIIHPEDFGKIMSIYKRCVEMGESAHFDYRIRGKDGAYRYWEEYAIPVFQNEKHIKWFGVIRDITELKKTEEKLFEKRNLLKTIINATPDIIVLKDRESVYQYVNSAFCKFIGKQESKIIGKTDFDLFPHEEAKMYRNDDKKIMKTGRQQIKDEEVTGTGGTKWFQVVKSPVLNNKGVSAGILYSLRNITKRKKMEEQLQATAITDELTGLFNRRGFYTISEKHCKLATRFKRGLSLLYLDIDGMKNINDELGHKAGDQALVDTANILKMTFRETDIIARIGGDEFAVLLTEHSDPDIESIIINHLMDNLKIHNEQNVRNYELLFSVGFVHHNTKHLCSIDRLLTRADELMYEDKMHHKLDRQIIQSLNEKETERRVYKRFRTENKCWAELNGSGKIKIKDISIGGICLKTPQHLNSNSKYKIKMFSNNNGGITSKGKVVWSDLMERENKKEASSPYYESGLKFVEMNDNLKTSLMEFIGNFVR